MRGDALPDRRPWRRAPWWFARVAWAALAGIHTPLLFAVIVRLLAGPTAESIGGAFALALSLAFFVLKTADVAFLRIPCRRATFIMFVLVTALLHREMLAPAVDEPAVVTALAVAGVSWALHRAARRRRLVDVVIDRWLAFRGGLVHVIASPQRSAWMECAAAPVIVRRAGSRCAIMRGPPRGASRRA